MISAQSPSHLIKSKLLENNDIIDAVGMRIYTQHFIDFDDGSVTFPLIIIDSVDGDANYGKGYQRNNIQVYVYSLDSASQCTVIYDLVYSSLQGARLYDTNYNEKGYCREVSRLTNGFNEQIKAWFFRGTFVTNTVG